MTAGTAADLVYARTPKGNEAVYSARHGTSDGALVSGIIGEDEYDLKDLPELTGWAIDIGAHIGTVAVALALDHLGLRVLAVEALPENVKATIENIGLNDLIGRVHILPFAASSEEDWQEGNSIPVVYGWSKAENQPDAYMQDNRFIGGMVHANETSTTIQCQAFSLEAALAFIQLTTGDTEVELLKIDCEGCEWQFLTSPFVARCKRIWGEYHEAMDPTNTYAELLRLLEPTHEVKHIRGTNVGIFQATRR